MAPSTTSASESTPTAEQLKRVGQTFSEAAFALLAFTKQIAPAIDSIKAANITEFEKFALAEHRGEEHALISDLDSGELTDKFFAMSDVMFRHSDEYSRIMRRMALVYLIALYDALLCDLLKVVFRRNPKMLKSGERTMTYEEILSFETTDGLVSRIVDQEVYKFGFLSLSDQAMYVHKRLKLQLTHSSTELSELIEFREVRNLLVHANGVVNEKYIKTVKGSAYVVGDVVEIDGEYLRRAFTRFSDAAENFCEALIEKFGRERSG
jgi:hypothetical protein